MLVLESVLTLQPGYKYPPNATSQHEERLWSQYLKCTATAANGILFCLIHYSSPTAAVKSYLGLSHLLPPLKTGSNIKMLGHIFGVADPMMMTYSTTAAEKLCTQHSLLWFQIGQVAQHDLSTKVCLGHKVNVGS